jgi:hypothetical protein
MSSLDHRSVEFVDRDVYLHILLGLVSATERAQQLLRKGSPTGSVVAATPDHEDEPLLFMLGVVAFATRLRSHLEAASSQGRARIADRPRTVSGIDGRGWSPGALR